MSRSRQRPPRDGETRETLRLALLAAFSALCFAAAIAAPTLLAARPATSGPPPELQAELRRMVELDGAPGVAVRVYQEGRLLYAASAGEPFEQVPVPVASASKWVATALIMSLVDEGLLSLDEPIGRRLPEFQGEAGKITLRQLLSYTSGHESLLAATDLRQSPDLTLRESARQIASRPLAGPPGTAFRYGGPGLQIAGALAEQASGLSWSDLFRRRLAEPLGMSSSHWIHPLGGDRPSPVSNPMIQAGLVTTAEDYSRFLAMLADKGRYAGRQVLSEQAVALLGRPQTLGLEMAYTPPGVTGPLAYNLGNWCEDPAPGPECRRLSSPGALGTYPWLDRDTGVYGVFVTRVRLPRISARIQSARRIIEADAAQRSRERGDPSHGQ